jgi:two-component system CheB/CheR fusion protein
MTATQTSQTTQRVLVVDDNVDAADTLAMSLRMDGYFVGTAYGAREALDQAEVFRPDVVVLDLSLPEMDGFEVARRIRSMRGFEAVRLVAVTGYGEGEVRTPSRAKAFDAYLVKPISPTELEATITLPTRR